MLSSWINFRIYDLDRGNALGDRFQAVRPLRVGVINGLQVILFALGDGGLAVLVVVEKLLFFINRKLLAEPPWNQLAIAR